MCERGGEGGGNWGCLWREEEEGGKGEGERTRKSHLGRRPSAWGR